METIITNFSGLIVSFLGMLFGSFLYFYISEKGKNLATKEDIKGIRDEIESVKVLYKTRYDLSVSEREFYADLVKIIQNFLSIIKRFELEHYGGKENTLTRSEIMTNPELRNIFLDFCDAVNEILARAFVFLNEESYGRFLAAFKSGAPFSDLRLNLLNAMRQSIHRGTSWMAEKDSRDIKYVI